jgi:hypothetical protein
VQVNSKTDLVSEDPQFLIFACQCIGIASASEITQIPLSDSVAIEVEGIAQTMPQFVSPKALTSKYGELKLGVRGPKKLTTGTLGLRLYVYVSFKNPLRFGMTKAYTININ